MISIYILWYWNLLAAAIAWQNLWTNPGSFPFISKNSRLSPAPLYRKAGRGDPTPHPPWHHTRKNLAQKSAPPKTWEGVRGVGGRTLSALGMGERVCRWVLTQSNQKWHMGNRAATRPHTSNVNELDRASRQCSCHSLGTGGPKLILCREKMGGIIWESPQKKVNMLWLCCGVKKKSER